MAGEANVVTQVTRNPRFYRGCGLLLLLLSASALRAADEPRTAEELYQRLRTVALDERRVYHVREASLERPGLHISLIDGTIAFTQDVFGKSTGAFFEGEGEILVVPPDRAERASMALFTGAAILEEKFSTAFFRFNDDTFQQLNDSLRPAEDRAAFVSRWGETVKNLAEGDALRLLLTFSQWLPVSGGEPDRSESRLNDHLLRARLQVEKLGVIDAIYDSAGFEPVSVGKLTQADGVSYFDVWTSFNPAAQGGLLAKKEPTGLLDTASIPRYRIRVRVHPPRELDVDANVEVSVERGGERALAFELSRFLRLQTVEVDGKPVEFIHNPALEGTQLSRRGNDQVVVIFPRRLQAGQKLTLHFIYSGEVLSEAGGGLLWVGARGTWYPNRGMAMSEFDQEFIYPQPWSLVATGKPVPPSGDFKPREPGEQVSRWVSERPIPFSGFNLGRYERAEAKAGTVAVESYAAQGVEKSFPRVRTEVVELPDPRRAGAPQSSVVTTSPMPSPARNAQAVADRAAQAVEYFSERFGRYPYSSLSLTQMPGRLSQGWPGLIFLSSFAFLSPEERAQLRMDPIATVLDQQVVAHETAHQWWGDLVIWKSYRDQWMFEGLSNYCSLMMLESRDPAGFRAIMDRYRAELALKNKSGETLNQAGPVTLGLRLSSSRFPNGYEAISYGRGTWLFHMLRNMLLDGEKLQGARGAKAGAAGEEPFLRALRKLREQNEGKAITTRDLLHALEQELPRGLWFEDKPSLDWFLDSWVNGIALPELGLKSVKFTPREKAVSVSGTIMQRNAPADLITSVPVYASLPGKAAPVLLGRVFADGEETPFHFSAPVGTRGLLLDPKQTVLTRPH
jgi:hypothetical protein